MSSAGNIPLIPDSAALAVTTRTAADRNLQAANLAARSGSSPEQGAARQQVVRTFFQLHFPDKSTADVEAYLRRVDLRQPVQVVNAAGIDTSAPAGGGILGFGRKPQYLLSPRFPPVKPGDPVYALKSYPAKS